jgi:Spy/CpxP family protein refolding chaperone
MRFKTNLFLMAFTAFLFIGTQSFSQGMQNKKCDGQNNSKQGIENKIPDLTDTQKKDIDKIRLAGKKKTLPITNQLKEKRAHLNTLKTTEPIDKAAIDKQIEEIGKLRTELSKIREDGRLKIRNVLTDEQKIVFDSEVGRHKSNRKPGCSKKCKH